MEYIRLKHMNMSRIVLGCDRYGESIDEKTAYQIIDAYKKFGGNVLDTARMYTSGESERIVGRYLKDTASRNDFYISTKCAHYAAGTTPRLTRDDILFDAENSLKALGVDYIDLLWLHRDDVNTDVKEIIDTLDELVKSGAVKEIGASNWTCERIAEANEYVLHSGKKPFCASQILYNMAKCRYFWDESLVYMEQKNEKEFYEKIKMPVFAFSSQAKGFFEKYAEGNLSEKSRDRYYCDETLKTYEKIAKEAEKNSSAISHEALKMLVNQSKFEVFPIIGPSNIAQLEATFNAK